MGAPISGVEKLAARQALRSAIVESWGNSESLGTITEAEDLDIRPDSIGRPFLTDRLLIVDDDGRFLSALEQGRLAGDEEAGFSRYSRRPEETARVKRRDLIISDDIGFADEAGYFFIRGRVQESVVVGDQTLFVPELEASIRDVEGVRECCIVVGQSISESGLLTVLVAPVSPSEVPSDLLARLNAAMPGGVQLSSIRFVEALPRLASGKVDRVSAYHLASNSS
jgi:acyl-coenzyme A synthetase/AMP-(fatty) acid ligase